VQPTTILEAAERAVAAGISVVPIRADGSKAPAVAWSSYQERLPTPQDLRGWFAADTGRGMAIIGGSVSGGLEVLDFDDLDAFNEFVALCRDHELVELAKRLPIAVTPGDGRHLYYRHTDAPQGNQKLARSRDQQVRIETRGEGGYAIVPPSPASCHPSGRAYEWLKGSLESLPVLTPDERRALLTMARILNEWVEPERVRGQSSGRAADGTRPGDDFNARGDVQALLERHGWRFHRRDRLGELWTRPGKEEGNSARLFNESRLFCPFSSNAQPFEADASYSPFAVYAELECGGDYQEAARRLGREGYGAPPQSPGVAHPGLKNKEEKRPLHCFPNTDYGNAERLVELEGEDIRYIFPWKTWLCWDGVRWLKDQTGEIYRHAKRTVREMYSAAAKIDDDAMRQAFSKWARESEKRSRLEAMIALAQSEPSVPVLIETLDQDHWKICCTNGTLNLKTGKLQPHDRQDMITKMIPVAYDPNALCPTWDAFLERIIPDPEVRIFLQRAVGYSLTGEVSAQCLFFLYGKGANGKSTFINAMLTLLGDYGMQAAPDILLSNKEQRSNGPCPEIAGLVGSRFVATSEIDEGRRLAEGLVKQITGGEPIRARFMHQDFFEFHPTHKLWFSANHKPVIRGQDDGIWRRIKFVPFTVTIPPEERDPDLNNKLTAEMPGILAWAVRGCLAWSGKDLSPGLTEPAAIRAASAEYRNEMDVLAAFLEDCCILDEALASGASDKSFLRVVGSDLYGEYVKWAEANGEKPLGKKLFGSRLQERGGITPGVGIGPKKARGWIGIGLKSQENMNILVTNDSKSQVGAECFPIRENLENEDHLSLVTEDDDLWEII
jgi:P4 family phage/plasmid primase-like protien